MRKVVYVLAVGIMMLFTSCLNSSKPQGNPEKDAAAFAESIYDCYKNDDVNMLSDVINEYYSFYKNASKIDQKVFFEALRDEMEKPERKMNSDKFENMVHHADKYDKLDQLSHNVQSED